jgi:WD40 repeat protein
VTVSTASHAGFPGDYFMVPPTPEYGATGFGAPVYDPQIKEVFFSNPSMNEVEAYSTEDGHRVGAVTVPGPMGLSLSPDNTLLAVGTSTPYVYFVDPLALHVTGQVEIPLSYFSFSDWGEEAPTPYLMASGPMLIAIGSTAGGELVSYNLATNTFARANPSAGGGFSDALPARSLDGKYLIVLTSDQQLALYSAAAQGYVSSGPGAYYRTLAANLDGTQFAAAFEGGKIAVLNQALQQQYQYTITNWPDTPSLVFSRDGKYLYIRENLDLAALNAQTGALAGYQGLSIASTDSGIVSDVDENYRAIGATSLGVFVSSVANLQPKVPPQLNFFTGMGGSTVGNPNEGALAGGTAVQTCSSEVGSLFGSSEEAYFGTIAATSDAISGACITATTPAASTAGPVTLLLTDANNNAVLVPNGYSYGPHVHWLSPDALSPKQPSTVWISTDGILPWNANVQTLTIGGKSDSVVVSNQTTADPTGFNAGVTPGSPGWGDLTLTLTDGSSETVKNAVQFLAQDVTVGTGNYTSAVYDALRDRFYLVGTNNKVAVFDPGTAKFLQPLQSSLVSSNAVLGSVAITPDDSKLVVSDVADRSVVVFDLASGTSVAANVLLPSETLSSAAPIPVITTNGNQAFVFPILMDMMSSVIREIDLSTMAVQTRSDIPPALGGFPPNSASSSGDGSVALFGWSFAGGTGGFQYLWKYDSAADTFSAPIQFPAAESFPLAVNADGSVLSAGINILGQDLEPVVPLWDSGAPYSSLTASGALLYRAGGAVEILDVRSGRSLLIFPVFTAGPADYASAFAIDPTGRKILACGANSLMYFELSAVPLAAVTVTPSAAAPGETVTVRGNGFVSGTSATIRGASAACTMQDDSTLQCEVPNVSPGTAPMFLTNPDGQEYLFEGAMVVQ